MKKILFIVCMMFLRVGGMQMPQSRLDLQLGQAVIDMNVAAVRSLLAQGVDPNKSTAYGELVLQFAVMKKQNVDVVKALLDAGADPSLTPDLLCNLLNAKKETPNSDIYYAILDMLLSIQKLISIAVNDLDNK